MFILAIHHNIFLTRKERYQLANGEPVKTIAANIPVWFYRFATSEPATEVFCEYILTNSPGETNVQILKNGYKINIPQLPEGWEEPVPPTNEEWQKMSPIKQEKWYVENMRLLSGLNLLDHKDRGAKRMYFEYKIDTQRNGHPVKQTHTIEISDISVLEQSLTL